MVILTPIPSFTFLKETTIDRSRARPSSRRDSHEPEIQTSGARRPFDSFSHLPVNLSRPFAALVVVNRHLQRANALDRHRHVVTVLERTEPLVIRAAQQHVTWHEGHVSGDERQYLDDTVLHVTC
jgi:hypothetical protein